MSKGVGWKREREREREREEEEMCCKSLPLAVLVL